MKRKDSLPMIVLTAFLLLAAAGLARAEDPSTPDTMKVGVRPTIEALRAAAPPVIDGRLSEQLWQRPGSTRFTQRDPVEGTPPTQRTEVWVSYDDEALYVAARMFDSAPDSITARIGRRDADLASDMFYVGVDSYHDRRTGFFFMVYASGAISDGTLFNDDWDDNSWDGIWDAATQIDDKGWTAELRIPYSQLRFPEQESHVWGINFIRRIDRNKERDDFVLVPKAESGFTSRFADLTGIREIHPPSRLEILPYVVSGTRFTNQIDAGDPFRSSTSFNGNFGADVKLGLGSNLTLNATFNPDFGQVEVDPAVVNLSAFETFYDEKRPFFIEGSNTFSFGYGGSNNNWGFNWGNPNFFYSRRVGRAPRGSVQHDGFTDVPDGTTILGAAKLTGKIDTWTIGSIHAFTEREYARVDDGAGNRFRDIVEPFTSYNVVRAQREFNSGHQGLGFIGTAVGRDMNAPYLADQFNSSSYSGGLDGWTNLDSSGTYVITGWFAGSRVQGDRSRITALQQSSLHYFQRSDSKYLDLDTTATSMSGYGGRVAINKQKGNFSLNTAVGIISPGFDSNDMGFMFRTDVINAHLVLGYNWYEPDGFFRSKWFNVATFRSYNYGGEKTGEGYFWFSGATLMNYWHANLQFQFNPAVVDPRGTRGGPIMKGTNAYSASTYWSTDSRSSVVYELGVSSGRSESGGYRVTVDPGISFKPSPGVSVSFYPEVNRDITMAQWVTNIDDASAVTTLGTRPVFAKIDQREYSASIRLDWTFTPKLSLQLYMQPLISVGTYSEFKELRMPGTYTFNRYGVDNGSSIAQTDAGYEIDPDGTGQHAFAIDNPDFNFKSLRGNAVLRWEYLPGSTLYFVWTQSRTNFDNPGTFDFGRDLGNTFGARDYDSAFLVKLAYWWHP
jgi:hypothetical protein